MEQYQLHGIGASTGWAIGPVARVIPAPEADPWEPGCSDPEADLHRIRQAAEHTAEQLRVQARITGGDAGAILEATAVMACDPALFHQIKRHLNSGRGLTVSVSSAIEDLIDKGGFLAERATDLRDIRDRVVAHLLGLPTPGAPVLKQPSILVAEQLTPAALSRVNPAELKGIVTVGGGPTDHTATVAAQLGVPLVVQVAGALQLKDGDRLAIDALSGLVIGHPSDEEVEQWRHRRRRQEELVSGLSGTDGTADGHEIAVLANVNSYEDVTLAQQAGATGTGLYRTEFLYLERLRPPTLSEQVQAYRKLCQAHVAGQWVTVRIVDVGGDKPLEYMRHDPEANPALGTRGIRMAMQHPELLETQLEALAIVQNETEANIRVMAPMLTTTEEADYFLAKARSYGLKTVGVMLETPAAALKARSIMRDADFASIGVNDLTQYTMAADRLDGRLANLLDPWQPAVLHLVNYAIMAAHDSGVPLSMCGEAAGDPLLALVYVGMGAQSVSMVPSKVAMVRICLAHHDLEQCQRMARAALDARTANEAYVAVFSLLNPELKDLF